MNNLSTAIVLLILLLVIVPVALFLGMHSDRGTQTVPVTDNIFIDHETGCQYYGKEGAMLSPRFTPAGVPWCRDTAPSTARGN